MQYIPVNQLNQRLGTEYLKSLIIHEENTKEINTETEFGYVMKHLHKIKPTFIPIFSLNTDSFEMLDQTLGRVFDILHQTLRIMHYFTRTRIQLPKPS